MNIGGFQKNTLIDFPGQVACLVFTRGCNFTCPYCHNPGLVGLNNCRTGEEPPFTDQDVFTFLEKRKGLIDGVAITGGEPSLQKNLSGFCRHVKQMGFKVKIDTNGSRPEIIESLIHERIVDYIAMDIKTDLAHYPLLSRHLDPALIEKSIERVMSSRIPYEFRTTCAAPFVTLANMMDIGKMINGAAALHLQKCSQKVNMLDPLFAEDTSHFHSDAVMEQLKQIVHPFVNTCTIR